MVPAVQHPSPHRAPDGPDRLRPAPVRPVHAAIAGWWALAGGRAGLVHHDAPPLPSATFTVDVNAAGTEELAQLPGLGPATARRIVEHRDRHGPFATIESLLDVPGIGPATLAGMRPHLRPLAARSTAP
jgi:competence ComEA-like helix-hairpin-helix protein